MKRKFSFNLGPIRTTAKSDDKPTPEPTPSHASSHSHRRQASKDSKDSSRASKDGVCDDSPWINRRPLDAHTEQELRLACRLILQNFKPSDHGMENTDPKLDFGAMDRRRERMHQPTELKVRMLTGAPGELSSVARKSSKTRTRDKADREIKARAQGDVPARANSSRKRADFGWLDERDDKRDEKLKSYGKSPSIDIPRSATIPNDSDEDVSLPVTMTSTLVNSKVASNAPTSASLPSGLNSNRRSRQLGTPAAVADAQAAEWMRQERDKQKHHDSASPPSAVRLPSRTASIKDNIKGYVFSSSRSRTLSRAQSTDSLRTSNTTDSEEPQRSGWRGWSGVARKMSSRSLSRPGTSITQSEEPNEPRKSEAKEVNLNRELPPLPGLDTWKEQEQEQAKEKATSPKSPIAGTHIASLMRAQEQQHQDRSPAARSHHRKSGSDTLAMQFTQAYPIRQSSRNPTDVPVSPRLLKSGPSSPINVPQSAGISSISKLEHRHKSSSSVHTQQRSREIYSIPISTSKSLDPATPSHKMSIDSPFRMAVAPEVKSSRKEEQKSRLKKVISKWMVRKEKKDDWMHTLEKEGVNEGVMVHDGKASPVVRYQA